MRVGPRRFTWASPGTLLPHWNYVWICIALLASDKEGNGNPLQNSCLENPMDGGTWWAIVPGVAKSRTRLSNFTFAFYFHALEKEMATDSSVLAWRIPGTEEPGGLPSMGSHRVRHDWHDLAAAAAWPQKRVIAKGSDASGMKSWVTSLGRDDITPAEMMATDQRNLE